MKLLSYSAILALLCSSYTLHGSQARVLPQANTSTPSALYPLGAAALMAFGLAPHNKIPVRLQATVETQWIALFLGCLGMTGYSKVLKHQMEKLNTRLNNIETPNLHTNTFSKIGNKVAPYSPSLVALGLMGSSHVPFKQQFRISTETLQRIQWGCFLASAVIIAWYFFYIHKSLRTFTNYMEANDAGIASDQQTNAYHRAIDKKLIEAVINAQPPEKQEKIRQEIMNPHGKVQELLGLLQDHLAQNNTVYPPAAGQQA